jgi:hypothetical protein
MNAPTNPQLSAPTDDFLADLERFSVPFGREINGHYISSPPAAWDRVFNGPHGADGKPLTYGGLRARDVAVMRQEVASRATGPQRSSTLPNRANSFFDQRYSAAVTAPPAREPAAEASGPRTPAQQAPMKKAHG